MKANESSGFEIVTREDFSDVTYLLEIRHPLMAKAAHPGQFVIVMSHEHGERIPLTIADFDREEGHHHAGHTGRREDDQGNAAGRARSAPRSTAWSARWAFPATSAMRKKWHASGGGLGVAPVYPQARAFKESGAYVIGIVGFRTKDLIFWEDKFRACCDEFIVCTDDGSAGIKGLSPTASSWPSRSIPISTRSWRSARRS